jgi:hypothetical protein
MDEFIDKKELASVLKSYAASVSTQPLPNGYDLHSEFIPADQADGRKLNSRDTEWFYTYTNLQSETCSSTPPVASGIITNTCLVDVKRNDSSVFVACNSSKL